MRLKTLLLCLLGAACFYLVVENPGGILDDYLNRAEEVYSSADGSSADDTAPSNRDALQYALRYVGQSCRLQSGRTLLCRVKNNGSDDLFSLTVEVRITSEEGARATAHQLFLEGPFLSRQAQTVKAEVDVQRPIVWLGARTKIVDARY